MNPLIVDVSKNTLKKRKQRQKIKEDKERLEQYREKDRIRKKQAREAQKTYLATHPNLKTAQQEKDAEYMKLYMRKYREKNNTGKQKAAKKRESQREINRGDDLQNLKKRNEVLRMQKWRMKIKLGESTELNKPSTSSDPIFTSPRSERRTVSKVKKVLPITPKKRIRVVEKILNSPTLRNLRSKECDKTKEREHQLICNLEERISEIAPKGTLSNSKKVAYKTLKLLKCKRQNKLKNWWVPEERKKRKDSIPDNIREKVAHFYLSAEVSRVVPDKRSVVTIKTNGKVEQVQRQNMTMTVNSAYVEFKQLHPDIEIGFSMFKQLRPKQVRRISETNLRSCLCLTCCNPALKLNALKKIVSHNDLLKPFRDVVALSKKNVIDLTVCPYESKHPKPGCLKRTCERCGPQRLKEHCSEIIQVENGKTEITWNKWQHVEFPTEDGTKKRIMSCTSKTTTLDCFFEEYVKDLEELPSHIFRAEWQQKQIRGCIDALKDDDAVLCMDYAENYKCRYQEEVQSAFFNQNRVTIHPMMSYYREDNTLVKHAIIGVTDDPKKDNAGVLKFEEAALEIIEKNKGKKLRNLNEFTDGCACQYKGKNAFHDLSRKKSRPQITRNFYETSHGKSVCDGLGAVVKNSCYQAVLSGKTIIANADDLMGHCIKTLTVANKTVIDNDVRHISRREFIFIKREDVDRCVSNVKPLLGTRKLHSIKTTGNPMELMTRNLTCNCNLCEDGITCVNSDYVSKWETKHLQPILVKAAKKAEKTCILVKVILDLINIFYSGLILTLKD